MIELIENLKNNKTIMIELIENLKNNKNIILIWIRVSKGH